MTETAVSRWRARMGLTQRAAAAALGLTLRAYQEHERGAYFADDKPREDDLRTLLACAALEAGIEPIK